MQKHSFCTPALHNVKGSISYEVLPFIFKNDTAASGDHCRKD